METQAEYELFPGNEYKLPHGTVSWRSSEDPMYPGMRILLDGVDVLWIEECVEDGKIQTHAYRMPAAGEVLTADDEPAHTEVLRAVPQD